MLNDNYHNKPVKINHYTNSYIHDLSLLLYKQNINKHNISITYKYKQT